MDPIINCVTGVCCPPEQRQRVLAKAIEDYCHCDAVTAGIIADWILETFDLAPHGTLGPLVDAIARLARQHPHGAA